MKNQPALKQPVLKQRSDRTKKSGSAAEPALKQPVLKQRSDRTKKSGSADEHGNALFLILIAVILFAALSYAITQSNRSGGDVGRENNAIVAAAIMQYPASLSQGTMRLVLRGEALDAGMFMLPSNASFEDEPSHRLFHTNGGGVVYQPPNPNWVEENPDIGNGTFNWLFIGVPSGYAFPVGTMQSDVAIALLPFIKKPICEAINEKVTGSKDIPHYDANTFIGLVGLQDGIIDGHYFNITTPLSNSQLCVAMDYPTPMYTYYNFLME